MMSLFCPCELEDNERDELFVTLLLELERNADLEKMKERVNSIRTLDKYKLLESFLCKKNRISEEIILKCLPVFLDERTHFFHIERTIHHQASIKTILEIISRCCPNIDTIDIREFIIEPENKENFKTFLKQTPSLKSLRVYCSPTCAIRQLFFEEEFYLHDQEVRFGLQKIDYIYTLALSPLESVRLLKLLPNLKGFGLDITLDSLFLSDYIKDEEIIKKLYNLTEIADKFTSLTMLERFVKMCPNANSISLFGPKEHVVENLWKFPEITELHLRGLYSVNELYTLLEMIGTQITILIFISPFPNQLDREKLRELCPRLSKFDINNQNCL